MTRNARAFLLGFGSAGFLGGLALLFTTFAGSVPLMAMGGLIIASVVFEGRYGRQGRKPKHGAGWELTDERFVDDETGELVEVWMDPRTGERRYEPLNPENFRDPRKP